jgi:undecaprenyl-diphosphatase
MPSPTSARARRPAADQKLTVEQALALGALQGPAELLPVSSSAHISAAASLLGWRYGELEPELRKSFEVALHAGTALALLISLRAPILDRRSALVLGLACAPPALAGYVLEEGIERRLGSPTTIAAGLLAGSVAMTVADRCPEQRRRGDAGIRDGLWLGIAQACALIPGVSRAGATRSAARLLRFGRTDARLLSDEVGLPVLAGAALLKAIRVARRGLEPQLAPAFGAGIAGSFASTLVCAGLTRRRTASGQLLPYAAYRVGLAAWLLIRLRRAANASRRASAAP